LSLFASFSIPDRRAEDENQQTEQTEQTQQPAQQQPAEQMPEGGNTPRPENN